MKRAASGFANEPRMFTSSTMTRRSDYTFSTTTAATTSREILVAGGGCTIEKRTSTTARTRIGTGSFAASLCRRHLYDQAEVNARSSSTRPMSLPSRPRRPTLDATR